MWNMCKGFNLVLKKNSEDAIQWFAESNARSLDDAEQIKDEVRIAIRANGRKDILLESASIINQYRKLIDLKESSTSYAK